MSSKTPRIAAMIEAFHGHPAHAHYLGFFECFNGQLFFEAHEVLEDLWLQDRQGPNGDFYKGLIQFAGAFVHVQKHRPGPAVALLKLAEANLSKYGTRHEHLDVAQVLTLGRSWMGWLADSPADPGNLLEGNAPRLTLFPTAYRM